MRLRSCSSDDAGNVMVALALSVIVSGLIATLLHATVSSVQGTGRDRDYTAAVHVADAGLQHALYTLNRHRNASDLATRMSAGSTGTTGSGSFTWTATAAEGSRAWQITSRGSARGRARTVVGVARNLLLWPNAVVTDRRTRLLGSNTVDSYDSSSSLPPPLSPGQGSLGTNGTITTPPSGTTVDGGVTLYNTGSDPSLSRCTGVCTPLRTEHYPRDLTSADALSFITNSSGSGALDVCKTQNGGTLPDWIASVHGGTGATAVFPPTTPASGPYCFRRLVFDRNTTLSSAFTASNPALTYVEETVLVRGRVRVNAPSGVAAPVSPALRVYTATRGLVSFGSQATFAGAVYAPRAECGDKSGGAVELFGGLVCGVFDTRGSWRVHYDVALLSPTINLYSIALWREG